MCACARTLHARKSFLFLKTTSNTETTSQWQGFSRTACQACIELCETKKEQKVQLRSSAGAARSAARRHASANAASMSHVACRVNASVDRRQRRRRRPLRHTGAWSRPRTHAAGRVARQQHVVHCATRMTTTDARRKPHAYQTQRRPTAARVRGAPQPAPARHGHEKRREQPAATTRRAARHFAQ